MIGVLLPQDQVSESQTSAGLRQLIYDALCSQTMGVLTGGAILVAFAMQLGASDLLIGLLASIGPATQLLQIPAIALVDRTRKQKMLVVLSAIASRVWWVVIALLP